MAVTPRIFSRKTYILFLLFLVAAATGPALAMSPRLRLLCVTCASCCNPTEPTLPPPPPPPTATVHSPPSPATLVPVPYSSSSPPPPILGYLYPPPTVTYFMAPPPPNPLLPYYPYYPKTRDPQNLHPSYWSSARRLLPESSSMHSIASVVAVLLALRLLS